MPKTRLQFPDGSILSIGTVSCDDQIHRAVCLSFTPADAAAPSMELEIPPKTVEVIIRLLQERAHEARIVNGERMLEYPEPSPAEAPRARRRLPRHKGKAKAALAPKDRPPHPITHLPNRDHP